MAKNLILHMSASILNRVRVNVVCKDLEKGHFFIQILQSNIV